jgi:HTH-type transcriptional regulator / antitoxin HigA
MTTPSEAISTAMAERGFRQADLLDIFGSRGRASEIINGKRAVPRSMIPKLALRLGIPLDVLIAPRAKD